MRAGPTLPTLPKQRSKCVEGLRQFPLAGYSKVRSRSRSSDVKILIKQLRVPFSQAIHAYEEYRLKFESFDVLYVKYANIILLANCLSI